MTVVLAIEGRNLMFYTAVPVPVQVSDTPQERAAVVTWWLATGDGLTLDDIIRATGLSRGSAQALLFLLVEVLPLKHDRADCWYLDGTPKRGWRPKFPIRQSQQRAAVATWLLASGRRLRTSQIAEVTNLLPGAAWRMMSSLARVIPIYRDSASGRWLVCAGNEEC